MMTPSCRHIYNYAKRESVKESFVPVLIKADDEILWGSLSQSSHLCMCLSGFMGYANLASREWLPNLNCMTWANLVSQDDMDTT